MNISLLIYFSQLVCLDAKVLLITNLPRYFDGCYREDDVADLLRPFGFIFKGSNIYVIPEKCMVGSRYIRDLPFSLLNQDITGDKNLKIPPSKALETLAICAVFICFMHFLNQNGEIWIKTWRKAAENSGKISSKVAKSEDLYICSVEQEVSRNVVWGPVLEDT